MNVWLSISIWGLLLASLPAFCAEEPDWAGLMKQGYDRLRTGDFQAALQAFRGAEQLSEQPGYSLDRRAISMNAMAMAKDELAQFSESEKLYRRSLAVLDHMEHRDDALYAAMMANLGGSFTSQGRNQEAEQMLREAIALHQVAKPRNETGLAMARNRLAKLLMNEHHFAEVDGLLAAAQSALEVAPGSQLQLSMIIHNRGSLLAYQGRYAESAEMFERSLALTQNELGIDHPMLAQTLMNLGTVYIRAGDYTKAKSRLERALSIAEHRLGTDHPSYGIALSTYADLLKKTGHKSEAKTASARAREILQSNARVNGRAMNVDISTLRAQ